MFGRKGNRIKGFLLWSENILQNVAISIEFESIEEQLVSWKDK